MKIQLKKPQGGRKVGTIMSDVPDGVAELWILRGIAVRVEDAEDAPVTPSPPHPVTPSPPPPRRRRPRAAS